MKKILTGFLYRAVRTWELWLSVAFMIFACSFNVLFDKYVVPDLTADYHLETSVTEAYRVAEEWRSTGDPLIDQKIFSLCKTLDTGGLIAIIVSILFAALFFGKLFSDGAIRNLVVTGYSKKEIFRSTVIFALGASLVMHLTGVITTIISILISGWKIPIYLPVLATMYLYMFMLGTTVISLLILLLFLTKKEIVALIATAGVVLTMFGGSTLLTASALLKDERIFDVRSVRQYTEEHPDNEVKLVYEFDIKNFRNKIVLLDNGEPVKEEIYLGKPNPHYISGTLRNILILTIYSNPASLLLLTLLMTNDFTHYRNYKEGLCYFFCLICLIWSSIFFIAGNTVFERKELN